MDKKLVKYPFLKRAKRYVEESEISLSELVNDKAFRFARSKSKERVIRAIEDGETLIPVLKKKTQKNHFYSYPLSRIIVSCIDDKYLTKRYALAESKSFYENLKKENKKTILDIAKDILSSEVKYDDQQIYYMGFTDFLKLTGNLKDEKWKLTNQRIVNGDVYLEEKDFKRVLQEGIRKKIENNLPIDVPEKICTGLNQLQQEIKEVLDEKKASFETDIQGVVKENLFPPCLKQIIQKIDNSQNISHTARFTVVSFLVNIGMGYEDILELFKVAPDFDEEKTRYQIEHIGGVSSEDKYTPPSCSTLKTYGLCVDDDWRCEKVSHPLGYYEWRVKSEEEKDEA